MKKLLLLCCLLLSGQSLHAADIVLLVIDNSSYPVHQALAAMDTGYEQHILVKSAGELAAGGEQLRAQIDEAGIILVDVMDRALTGYLEANIDISAKVVYALRGSTDDRALAERGVLFDSDISAYYSSLSRHNIENMLRGVIRRHLDPEIAVEEPEQFVELGIYHPAAPHIFTDKAAFAEWQERQPGYDSGRPRLALLFYSALLSPGQQGAIDFLVFHLEQSGFLVTPCFGPEQQIVEEFLLDERGAAQVDLVLSFSLKFTSALSPQLAAALRRLDVPLFSAISLYRQTLAQWRQNGAGIAVEDVAWTMAIPEISGLVEPTVLLGKEEAVDADSGRSWYISRPVVENIERLLSRLHGWIALQRKANSEKKLAILFYNHHQGKQNVGASYLNVFASLEEIFAALERDGYHTGPLPDEPKIKELILRGARNIGSWAPGELEVMIDQGDLELLERDEYEQWFAGLPAEFQDKVVAQWGRPGDFQMMLYQGKIVIPMIRQGNIVVLPEPARGWSDDPMKLYHDTTLYPHHQYLAVYLWLAKKFGADAMIHLGTHATYEWTPGKQSGLSPLCSPEVLVTDIPNLYPYIVDNVGEAIQAKRRGRGVMLSHLTPTLRRSELYQEYAGMAELAGEIEYGAAHGSAATVEKLKELRSLVDRTGILSELLDGGMAMPADQDLPEMVSHYLEEIKEEMIPFGMHTYGRARQAEEIAEMVDAMAAWNPDVERKILTERIVASAEAEMQNLLHGLNGRYVEPGEGNDPLRNPHAIPTGRNLYGFNPARLPSPAAWELGKKAADEIIARHLRKHDTYPRTVAVVLWAVETLRNEGVNESTLLWLMGIRPRWQQSGKVAGLEVVPGRELGRPRIDVLINASGLYRDLFPEKMVLLDEAVQLAIRQSDIDNLLAENSRRIRDRLLDGGMEEKEAVELSRLRVFSEEPGSYGNGVSEMTGASGLWQDEDEVVDVYQKRQGFAFGGERWGVPAGELFRYQLAAVDVALHSRSSNVYGLLDNDDMFQYLGGLAMAVRREAGRAPETLITGARQPSRVVVEDVAATLGKEIRSRYLNPRWIKGMQNEDYAGAREMSNFVEYLWGWQVTTPDKVSAAHWEQVFEVYVEDKYGLAIKEFLNRANPWAYQSLTARMLEATRHGYWQADEAVQRKLAVEYVVNVVEKGVACCDHTCNNPLLNQMVTAIISLPGILSAEMVEKFKIAVEQSAGQALEEQIAQRQNLQRQLASPAQEHTADTSNDVQEGRDVVQDLTEVEGYKMERIHNQDETTEVTSSGVQWMAGLVVLAIICLAAWGMHRAGKNY